MSFIEQVNSIKEGVLKRPEYLVAVNEMMETAKEYTAQKEIDESLKKNQQDKEEITL